MVVAVVMVSAVVVTMVVGRRYFYVNRLFLVACYATLICHYVGRSVCHTYAFQSFFDNFVCNYVNLVSN